MRARRRIAFAAVALMSAAFGSTCNSVVGPSEPDTNWRRYDSDRFAFYVRPGSFAESSRQAIAEALEDQYTETLARLDVHYAGRILMYLFESAGDAGFSSNRSGKAYPDTETVQAVCAPPFDGGLLTLLSHETNHVIEQATLGRPGTYFMSEGLPSAVLSTRFHPYGADFLYAWTAAHESAIPALGVLVEDDQWTDGEVSYNASASFLAFLLERYGSAPVRALYQVRSAAFPRRTAELLGRSLGDLEQDWRAFCRERSGIPAAAR